MTTLLSYKQAARLRAMLDGRELDVLGFLHYFRLLTTRHVQRLLVADGSVRARTRRTQYLLRRLLDLGLVTRLSRTYGGRRAGSSGFIYALSGTGHKVVTNAVIGHSRPVWKTSTRFQDHRLAGAELFVRLVEGQRGGAAEILAFDAEPACWHRYTGVHGGLTVLKPDVYVRMGIGTLVLSAFVEIDLGTESLPTISGKCERYVSYWRSGVEQRRTKTRDGRPGVFPFVVWLTTEERRREQIRGVIKCLPQPARKIFKVALLEDGAELLTTVPARSPVDTDSSQPAPGEKSGPGQAGGNQDRSDPPLKINSTSTRAPP